MSIGQVLKELRSDFPDVSISKIRFLESEGLVQPQRTSSGYRKFSYADVDRLRYILGAQRDHYLPLRVIKEHLDAIERGLEPPAVAGEAPRAPRAMHAVKDLPEPKEFSAPAGDLRMSRAELIANTELTDDLLDQLMGFGLIRTRPGTEFFDADALLVAATVARMSVFGIEPRHLRAFKTAADREVGLIDQVLAPIARGRDADAQARAEETAEELAALSVRLHAALVRVGLHTAH
ncbi:MAG: transcriptional regulator FtsR [Nocardioidaceae bacterium]